MMFSRPKRMSGGAQGGESLRELHIEKGEVKSREREGNLSLRREEEGSLRVGFDACLVVSPTPNNTYTNTHISWAL